MVPTSGPCLLHVAAPHLLGLQLLLLLLILLLLLLLLLILLLLLLLSPGTATLPSSLSAYPQSTGRR